MCKLRHICSSATIFAAVILLGSSLPVESKEPFHMANDSPATMPSKASLPTIEDQPVGCQDLGCEAIIFVKRKPYSSDHYYTDINNGTSPDRFLPENGIYIYNLRSQQEWPIVTAHDLPGGRGFIGKISLSFDAKKVLFDFRERADLGFRIWEVHVDGSGLRQVSFPPEDEPEKVARWGRAWHTDDIHPCYLPDGDIIFSSTRCEHTVLCGGSAHLVAPGLHRMKPDGSDVRQITRSPVSEFCPVVLNDGRVMYHRWEYIDKGARVSKTIWSMNPDGTQPEELYGVADDTTTVYMYPQAVPGSDHRLVTVGTCHFPQGGCVGAIMLIDFGRGVRYRGPDPNQDDFMADDHRYSVNNLTPHVFVQRRTEPGWHFLTEDGQYVHDRNGQHGFLYTHPFPINDHQFLVSMKKKPEDHYKEVPNAYGLYLVDTNGRHQLVHRDSRLSCWHALPLLARPTPPLLKAPRRSDLAAQDQAVCVVNNVYEGMEGVARGEVKWLRINEALPRYWSTGRRWNPSLSSSSWKAALWPRVQWGIVPVEQDGSAHFLVPAQRAIFFQALDADFQELQRERTYVNYAPGEVRSCNGCHGQSGRAVPRNETRMPLALQRPPSVPQPQPCDLIENGGDGLAGQVIHYPTDIQPIFDAKCVSCHGPTEPAGDLVLTDDVTQFYTTSYEQLAKKTLAGPIIPEFTSFLHGDRGNYNGGYLPPKSLGCAQSTLIHVLTDAEHERNQVDDHTKMLDENELMILRRWVDSNYQFYGSYFGRQHPQWRGPDSAQPNYDPADFRREATFQEATSFLAPEWHR
jgi:hypothetical protein